MCALEFSLWLLVCVLSVPPIISDGCAPALLPHRGPVAPQWRGHSDHLLSANCPAAPQDAGELATSRHSVLHLAETPLGHTQGHFFKSNLGLIQQNRTVHLECFMFVSMKRKSNCESLCVCVCVSVYIIYIYIYVYHVAFDYQLNVHSKVCSFFLIKPASSRKCFSSFRGHISVCVACLLPRRTIPPKQVTFHS